MLRGILAITAILAPSVAHSADIEMELNRLSTTTALIVARQDIDGHPAWSPNSDAVAVDIAGTLLKVPLSNVTLGSGDWRGGVIGILSSAEGVEEITAEELSEFGAVTRSAAREVTTRSGISVGLERDGLGVSLRIGGQLIWTSDLENCHSLALSPDDAWVAFICELNGLFVMHLRDVSDGT